MKSIELFQVQYKDGDSLGFVLAWISYVPIIAIPIFVSLLWFHWFYSVQQSLSNEARYLHKSMALQHSFWVLGLAINQLLAVVLKRLLKVARPSGPSKTYGMPSSHSQATAFLAVWFCTIVISSMKDGSISKGIGYFLILIAILVTILVAVSRVYLKYHTWVQVGVAVILGAVNALVAHVLIPIQTRKIENKKAEKTKKR